MVRHAVELAPRAQKDLETLSTDMALRITRKLRQLEENPHPRADTVKRLQGFKVPTYRLRIGDYRAVYRLAGRKVVVFRVIHRSELDRALRDLL